MPKINILRVKQYLALDADNHYVPAKEVQPGTDNLWRCPDCHCPVRLQDNIIGEEAWFEHFPPTKVTKADVSKWVTFGQKSGGRLFFYDYAHWLTVWIPSTRLRTGSVSGAILTIRGETL
jgi:hypothetical protein